MAAFAAALLLALASDPSTAGVRGVSAQTAPAVQSPAPDVQARAAWGLLAEMGGREWAGGEGRNRFIWSDNGRTLSWQQANAQGAWFDWYVFNQTDAGVVVRLATGRSRGTVSVEPDGTTVARVGSLGATTRFVRSATGVDVVYRPIPVTWRLTPTPGGWTGETLEQAMLALPDAPRQPSAPILVAQNVAQPPTPGRPAAPAAPAQRQAAPSPSPSTGGPIVLAAAPPPAARMRDAAPAASGARPAPPAAPTSREAQMAAQVETRRVQAAREAEAERLRQAQLAEERRYAEQQRRAEEEANRAAWSEGFAMLGALVGGVAAGSYSGGDMTAISAGMAAGAQLGGSDTEIAQAATANFEVERQRYEEQQAFEAEVHARTMAAMNDPDNPLTRQARADEEDRRTRRDAERAAQEREQREMEERHALEREQLAAENNRNAQNQQAERDRRDEQERQAAETRRREQEAAERRRQEEERRQQEEERRQAAERERQAREEQQRREADARRLEQERREAERNRLVDFREAVVLCRLSGPQAQFGNWDCEGPLQQVYVNFDKPNAAAQMRLMDCGSYRELPQAGGYRAFACGYGLHPNNPAPSRNVPEMLGVAVGGRATFRCPISSTGICRTQ